jgi:hypothetical protein
VSKTRFPWVLAGILIVAWAGWHAAGLILAVTGCAVVYGSSLRLHPRMRHGRCKGTGEHRSRLFPWVFRKCGRCSGGRIIRWGAGQWGSDHVQAERQRARQQLGAARREHRWR